MAQCDTGLTDAMLRDCLLKAQKGISNSNAVLINFEDRDSAASTMTGSVITDLVLKTGKTGYLIEWAQDLGIGSSETVVSEEQENGEKHTFSGRIHVPTSEAAERKRELNGGYYMVVFETKFKGTGDKDAFTVLGWQVGMKMTTGTWSTNENSSSIPFTLATADGDTEDYMFNKFLEVDYATSKATYDTLFVPSV